MKEEKDIAVIGMAGMFPGAGDIETFWENLKQGKDCICEPPDTRIEDYISFFGENVKKLTRFGYLESINRFDAQFFGIAPGEAPLIDPAQRILLEVVNRALEYGGYGGSRLAKTRTGVFIAGSGSRYIDLIRPEDFSMGAEVGNVPAVSAGRISHFFDLRGPSLLIDTACSSSLTALHYACESIKRGESAQAVVAAVSIYAYFDPRGGEARGAAGETQAIRGKVFDNSANGLRNGEGAGALLLKPLSRALADRDMICAVIKGTAVSHNGARAPTISGQKPEALAEVITQALENAGIDPAAISYIEASAAGTQMGDPIEIKAITDAYAKYTEKKQFCAIGSVKANIGHLNQASGLASIIKVILALTHQQKPPLAGYEAPNSYIDFKNSPVYIDTQLKEWEPGQGENGTRRAGVSSFSVSGTNGHIILEQAPPPPPHPPYPDRCQVVALSAKNLDSLKRLCRDIKEYMKKNPGYAIDDICYTMNTGRGHYNYRMAALCKTRAQLGQILENFAVTPDIHHENVFYHDRAVEKPGKAKAVFLFPGLEKDLDSLARDFYARGFIAARYMDECGKPGDLEKNPTALCFAFQYAQAKLWMAAGIKPAVVLGFGTGKYVSRVIQGKLKLTEALEICGRENIEESSFDRDKFTHSIRELYHQGQTLYLEIGPGSQLAGLTREVLQGKPRQQVLHSYGWQDKEKTLLKNIAALYVQGTAIDFSALYQARRLALPTYPYNRQRYWLDNPDYRRLGIGNGQPSPAVSRPGEPGDVSQPDFSLAQTRQTLERIWRDFFGNRQIGTDDDFFQLGGDSLKTMTVIAIIHKELKVKIPLEEFFRSPTIRQLAQYIHQTGSREYSAIQPVEKKEYYPLSSAQRRLYILQEMVPASTAYNIMQVLILEGEAPGIEEKFAAAFGRLINRHESFKTSLETIEHEPVQRIHPEVAFRIETYDMQVTGASDRCRWEEAPFGQVLNAGTGSTGKKVRSSTAQNHDPKSRELRANSCIHSFIRPFDLAQAPLLRVGLIKQAHKKYILMVQMHHIISDGVSINIIIADFLALYTGKELPALEIRYRDYSVWQNRGKVKEALQAQENYWRKEFQGDIPILDLPTDFPRPRVQDFQGSAFQSGIDSRQTDRLKVLAQEEKTTLYLVLISIYYILLHKLSGQQDIIIGTAAAGRGHADLQQVIGMFLNMMALRNFPRPDQTYREFLKQVKERVLAAFDNQDYQFEDLVDRLELQRDTSRNPLFDVLFLLQTQEETIPAIPGLKLKPYPYEETTSKFDLILDGTEVNHELIFNVNFSTKLFTRATVDIFVDYFKNIAGQVWQNPAGSIADIEVITPAKRTGLLAKLNENPEPEAEAFMAGTQWFQDRINGCLARYKDQAASETGADTLTYGELDARANCIAHCLEQNGIKKETFIGILNENRTGLIITILGIIKAGAVFIPLDPTYPDSRLQAMIRTAHIGHIIAGQAQSRHFEPDREPHRQVEFLWYHRLLLEGKPAGSGIPPAAAQPPGDKIYVYFTSGTTGTPKAIVGKNRSLLHFIDWEIARFNIKNQTRFSQLIVPGFDPYLRDIFVPLCSGGVVCIPGQREIILEPQRLTAWLEKQRIGFIHCVPGLFRLMAAPGLNPQHFKHLKFILLSGEKINPTDLTRWYKVFHDRVQLVNLYGPTETTLAKIHHLIRESDAERVRIPIGKPIKGSRVVILDENFDLCPPLLKGEICIRTPYRSCGYYDDPALNQEKFIPNPFNDDPADILYRSGDLGRELADGSIDILGRIDRQVKIRGRRIEPEEIETRLTAHPLIKEAAVIKIELTGSNEILCAYVVEKTGETADTLSTTDLTAYLANVLPDYMVPAKIMKIESMPRNPNGKIDYKRLPHPLHQAKKDHVPPRDTVEEKLLELWTLVLKMEKADLGVTDGFFERGGSSLNVMTLISQVHRAFDTRLTLGQVFNNPTIEKQAQIIRRARQEKYHAIAPREKRDWYRLSSAQQRIYIIQQMESRSTAYNIMYVVEQTGEPVKAKLEKVLKQLIHRHESFRTSFRMIDGEPVQQVHDTVAFAIQPQQVAGSPHPLLDLIDRFSRPFNLSQAPLLRAGTIKAAENRYILMADMHHIIADGASMAVFSREFARLYEENVLSPLKIQYKDFSAWQNKLSQAEEIKQQGEYWLKQLEGRTPQLNLPVDFARSAVQDFTGSRITFEIGPDLTRVIEEMALKQGATLFMILLAVYVIFLSKICSQQDIVVGTPIAGRRHADLEGIIGMFVNTLPLRNFPRAEKTGHEFLAEVKHRTLEAFENQDYQVERLVEQVAGKRDASRNPLFETMFTLQNIGTPGEDVAIKGMNLKPYEYENKIAKFDMQLIGYEIDQKLYFELEYCTKRFKKQSIEGFIRYFKAILHEVITDPGKTLSAIQPIQEDERSQILAQMSEDLENE